VTTIKIAEFEKYLGDLSELKHSSNFAENLKVRFEEGIIEMESFDKASDEDKLLYLSLWINSEIDSFINKYNVILELQSHNKISHLTIEELNQLQDMIQPLVDYSLIFRVMLNRSIKYEKINRRNIRKENFRSEMNDLSEYSPIKKFNQKWKIYFAHLKTRRGEMKNSRRNVEVIRRNIGRIRDLKVLSNGHMRKIKKYVAKY